MKAAFSLFMLMCGTLEPAPLFMASADQQPPRNVGVVAVVDGANLKIRTTYLLAGNPDSVLTRVTGGLVEAHRRSVAGTAATVDSFTTPRPAAGVTVAFGTCVQSKRSNGQVSAEICAGPVTYTEPSAPLPPPVVNPPTVDTTGLVLFVDTFTNGVRSGAQHGVSWGVANSGPNEEPLVLADGAGYSLAFPFQGNADLADDAWSEQRFKLPKLTEVFICMIFVSPANYVHRDATGPDNNKLLRVWDSVYSNSTVHVGMSNIYKPGSSPGSSQMIVEYSPGTPPGSTTGNYGTGPWKEMFRPGRVDTLGFYAKVSSAPTLADGVIKVWLNGALIYDQRALNLTQAGTPGGNYFANGYVLGWANSGFYQNTTIRLRKFLVAKQPVAC